MSRLNILLMVALVVSSLYLVRVSYEARRLFTDLDRARNEEIRLKAERERLDSERQAQATPLRVEKTSRTVLRMKTATPPLTFYVSAATGAVPEQAKQTEEQP
jgi:cell division protein FtsL